MSLSLNLMRFLRLFAFISFLGVGDSFLSRIHHKRAAHAVLLNGYVPSGMSEADYANLKKKEAQKTAAHKKKMAKGGKCGNLAEDVKKGKKTFVHLTGDAVRCPANVFFYIVIANNSFFCPSSLGMLYYLLGDSRSLKNPRVGLGSISDLK